MERFRQPRKTRRRRRIQIRRRDRQSNKKTTCLKRVKIHVFLLSTTLFCVLKPRVLSLPTWFPLFTTCFLFQMEDLALQQQVESYKLALRDWEEQQARYRSALQARSAAVAQQQQQQQATASSNSSSAATGSAQAAETATSTASGLESPNSSGGQQATASNVEATPTTTSGMASGSAQ